MWGLLDVLTNCESFPLTADGRVRANAPDRTSIILIGVPTEAVPADVMNRMERVGLSPTENSVRLVSRTFRWIASENRGHGVTTARVELECKNNMELWSIIAGFRNIRWRDDDHHRLGVFLAAPGGGTQLRLAILQDVGKPRLSALKLLYLAGFSEVEVSMMIRQYLQDREDIATTTVLLDFTYYTHNTPPRTGAGQVPPRVVPTEPIAWHDTRGGIAITMRSQVEADETIRRFNPPDTRGESPEVIRIDLFSVIVEQQTVHEFVTARAIGLDDISRLRDQLTIRVTVNPMRSAQRKDNIKTRCAPLSVRPTRLTDSVAARAVYLSALPATELRRMFELSNARLGVHLVEADWTTTMNAMGYQVETTYLHVDDNGDWDILAGAWIVMSNLDGEGEARASEMVALVNSEEQIWLLGRMVAGQHRGVDNTKVRAALATEGAIPTTFTPPRPRRQTAEGGDTIVPTPVFGRRPPRPDDDTTRGRAGRDSMVESTGRPPAGRVSTVAQRPQATEIGATAGRGRAPNRTGVGPLEVQDILAQMSSWQATVNARQEASFANQAAMATRFATMESDVTAKMSEISMTLALLMGQLNPLSSPPRKKGKAESRNGVQGGDDWATIAEEEDNNMEEQGETREDPGQKWQFQGGGQGGKGSSRDKRSKKDKNGQ